MKPFVANSHRKDKVRLRDGIWKINTAGRTVYANQRMAEMLGTTVDAMLGELSFGFVFPEDVEAAKRLFDTKKRGDSKPFQFRLRRADGSPIWVSISNTPMFSNAEFHGILGLFSEIESPAPTTSASP